MANFETIKLDKGLYNTTKGFLSELEIYNYNFINYLKILQKEKKTKN